MEIYFIQQVLVVTSKIHVILIVFKYTIYNYNIHYFDQYTGIKQFVHIK